MAAHGPRNPKSMSRAGHGSALNASVRLLVQASTSPSVGHPNERGYLLSAVLIGILAALLVAAQQAGFEAGPVKAGRGTVLLRLYVMAWGCMFLASYYFSHKSFFLRALVWVCEHFSYPRSRKMAFFYFALAFGLGFMALLAGLGIT